MDLHHRLMRRTINIGISKAIEDMRGNTKRGIRNLIDLGLFFSRSENQKWFFTAAGKVINNPRNPYNELASRMIKDVDNETIKTVGINLGYSSLTYGADKLRTQQKAKNCTVPWLLIFNTNGYDHNFQMEALIREGRKLGTYSYIFHIQRVEEIDAVSKIAGHFTECLFVLKTSPELITAESIELIRKAHNIVVSVQAAKASLTDVLCVKAFGILRDNRCFYGFHAAYNENTAAEVAAAEYIHRAISLGNIFGVYIAEEDVSASCRDAVYNFVCSARGETGQPLVTFEWSRDMADISRRIGVQEGYRVIRSQDQSYGTYKKEENGTGCSLAETIRIVMPYKNAESDY
ncbi:MAG: hypothetical protein AB1796_04515 [Bacillota bacterium]